MRSARPALARSRRREHHGGDGAVRVSQDLLGQARAAGGGRGEAVLAVQAQAALAGCHADGPRRTGDAAPHRHRPQVASREPAFHAQGTRTADCAPADVVAALGRIRQRWSTIRAGWPAWPKRSSPSSSASASYELWPEQDQPVARGLSNKRIARELAISEGTVKIHL